MTAGETLSVEERLDVQELFAFYCWSLNTGDRDGYLDCFTEDGWIEHFPPTRYQGREAISGMLDQLWYGKQYSFLGRQHHPNNFLLTREGADGIAAKVYCSITRLDQMTNTVHPFLLCNWNALCGHERGRWRFRELRVTHWLRQEVPWVGDEKARLVRPSDPYKAPGEF